MSEHSLQNSGAKYVSNKMPRQIQYFSVCLGNASAKKQPKTHQKPSYIMPAMALAYQLILLILHVLYCLLITHLNRWNGRQYFSVDHLVLVSLCTLVNIEHFIQH